MGSGSWCLWPPGPTSLHLCISALNLLLLESPHKSFAVTMAQMALKRLIFDEHSIGFVQWAPVVSPPLLSAARERLPQYAMSRTPRVLINPVTKRYGRRCLSQGLIITGQMNKHGRSWMTWVVYAVCRSLHNTFWLYYIVLYSYILDLY